MPGTSPGMTDHFNERARMTAYLALAVAGLAAIAVEGFS